MRDLARLGFVLLGLYFVVTPMIAMASYARFASPEGSFFPTLLFSLGVWVVFGLLPGAFLIARNRALAIYLFPEQPVEALDVSGLVTALVCVLGVYLFIRGIGNAIGGLFSVLALYQVSAELAPKPMGSIITALLLTAAGAILAFRAHAVSRFFFRPTS